jgi:hypothetical protein
MQGFYSIPKDSQYCVYLNIRKLSGLPDLLTNVADTLTKGILQIGCSIIS